MAIRPSLLALLGEGPKYGYQLRQEFETCTGGQWPLNVGQVYTTLSRLERDGCVVSVEGTDQSQVLYEITPLGRAEMNQWFDDAVSREHPARDELAIKLALAVTLPAVDALAVVSNQRAATMAALQVYTQGKREPAVAKPNHPNDVAKGLVLDSLLFAIEAELRWLDHCEARLISHGSLAPTSAPISEVS